MARNDELLRRDSLRILEGTKGFLFLCGYHGHEEVFTPKQARALARDLVAACDRIEARQQELFA